MIISLDTETTGKDLYHGSLPFLVTTCNEKGENKWWEWDVDPLTRRPVVPPSDLREIADIVSDADELVLQNPKFDYRALRALCPSLVKGWDWSKVRDTLVTGHLLATSAPHDLTSMALQYLGVDILPYETRLRKETLSARVMTRNKYKDWRLARDGDPDMPSCRSSAGKGKGDSDTPWKVDTWLPKALARTLKLPKDHPWWSVTAEYANVDSAVTMALWPVMWKQVLERGLEKLWRQRMQLLHITLDMEDYGVSNSGDRHATLVGEYTEGSANAAMVCTNIASDLGFDLTLPKSGNNASLTQFVFDVMKVPVLKRSEKTGLPSLDKNVMNDYLLTLPRNSKPLAFIRALLDKRKRDTALTYMDGYKRFWIPVPGADGWYRLHPNLNPTGTDTLRCSSTNPNGQNVSRKEGFNLRFIFGPAPGREWWSLDAKNIELRIPAYESGEEAFIALFERPDDPPYFGSNHLLIAHILHPRLFEECVNEQGQVDGRVFKKKHPAVVDSVKRGNFAVQYGAVDKEDGTGTADRAYGIPGSHARLKHRFAKQESLNQKWVAFANKHGYVETIPDKSVDPTRGFPILCSRTAWGKVLPTVPLNYHVQGTAMWWMMRAMIRCHDYLRSLNKKYKLRGSNRYAMVLQVHDELLFDFPRGRGDKPWETNLEIVKEVQRLMERGGDDIGVPTPVSCEYHAENWSEGLSL